MMRTKHFGVFTNVSSSSTTVNIKAFLSKDVLRALSEALFTERLGSLVAKLEAICEGVMLQQGVRSIIVICGQRPAFLGQNLSII